MFELTIGLFNQIFLVNLVLRVTSLRDWTVEYCAQHFEVSAAKLEKRIEAGSAHLRDQQDVVESDCSLKFRHSE